MRESGWANEPGHRARRERGSWTSAGGIEGDIVLSDARFCTTPGLAESRSRAWHSLWSDVTGEQVGALKAVVSVVDGASARPDAENGLPGVLLAPPHVVRQTPLSRGLRRHICGHEKQ